MTAAIASADAIVPATVQCIHCWSAASSITDPTDLGWILHDRIADVVEWLHANGCRRLSLTSTTRAALNEGVGPAVPESGESADVRACIPRVIRVIERATGVPLTDRARWVLGLGVIDADLLLSADTGRGPAIKLLHRLDHARDTNSNRGGGLRGVLADTPGIEVHEARLVARLLLGTETLDRDAIPLHYAGHTTQLGASAALVCGVLCVPSISQATALAWAHAAMRAMNPSITRSEMRRRVSDPLRRAASGASISLVPEADPAVDTLRAQGVAS